MNFRKAEVAFMPAKAATLLARPGAREVDNGEKQQQEKSIEQAPKVQNTEKGRL